VISMSRNAKTVARALQPKALFDSQSHATAVYQSHLTYQLRNLG
jgi:hypothetical protein